MVRPGLEQRIDEALAAGQRADLARHAGDLDEAATHDREAERLFEALAADDPDEPAHLHALGAHRYSAGETHLYRGDPASAVAVLRRAEETYQALAARGLLPEGHLGSMIADVRLRRARGLLQQGRNASALVESQEATLAYLRQWDGDAEHALALDTARVLSWHAYLTACSGDPDLAVAAADTALRVYLARATELNTTAELQVVHLPHFVLAARLAAVIHEAHGRTDLSAAAAEMGSMDVPSLVPVERLPTVDDIRQAPTLADALDRAGADGALRDQLTAPAVDGRLLTSADRCAPGIGPAMATRLGQLAERVTDDLAVLLRLSLEAHALLAHASESRDLSMRYNAGPWGAAWADLACRASQASHAAGLAELADDFGQWMAGALHLLGPHVLIDPEARATARRCTIWQGRYSAATGNEEGARMARETLDHLDTLDAAPPGGDPSPSG
jgi:tetratricopeptide (TPR) repeat protein